MKRIAVITGTSSGIGKAIARYYSDKEYCVVGINTRAVNLTVHPANYNYRFDLSVSEDIMAVVKQLKDQFGLIDVFVNNAGVMFLDDLTQGWEVTIPVNLIAPILLCEEIIDNKLMVGGHILNIGSVSGIIGDVDAPVYSACKAGIINFTRSLAKILAPDIRVNCISPGFFKTNLVEGDTPQELIDGVPMQREADPHEIVPVVDMLQKSSYITGANILIDGGLSL